MISVSQSKARVSSILAMRLPGRSFNFFIFIFSVPELRDNRPAAIAPASGTFRNAH